MSYGLASSPRFSMGRLVATPGALEAIPNPEIVKALSRHLRCDWGDLDAEDKQSNDEALVHGGRLFSAYHSESGIKFWIITESDHSVTTVLLPSEY